jgi:hypothetical protein
MFLTPESIGFKAATERVMQPYLFSVHKSLAIEHLYGARYGDMFVKEVIDEEEDTGNGSYCDI